MQLKCESGGNLPQEFRVWNQSKVIFFKDITLFQYFIHVKQKNVCSPECNRIQEAQTCLQIYD